MFAQRSRLRRFATQLLLVWLFAFGVGLVHACEMRPLLQAVAGAATGGQAQGDPALQPDAADAVADHGCCPGGDADGPANASCAKFCADESNTLPCAKQGHDPAPMLDVAPVATLALSVAVVEHSRAEAPEAVAPPPDPTPVAIAFLRLTL
jgi:hypothetical protein